MRLGSASSANQKLDQAEPETDHIAKLNEINCIFGQHFNHLKRA